MDMLPPLPNLFSSIMGPRYRILEVVTSGTFPCVS